MNKKDLNKILDNYFWGRIAFEYKKSIGRAYCKHDFQSKLAEIRNSVYDFTDSQTKRTSGEIGDSISLFIAAEEHLIRLLENHKAIDTIKIDKVTKDNFLGKE